MLFDGEPLQVSQLVLPAADEGFTVVDLVARAGTSRLAGAGAGVQALELGAKGGGARLGKAVPSREN